ncbi:MAG: type II secretion system protein GspJ [Candidatus Omnitrophota bacterium]
MRRSKNGFTFIEMVIVMSMFSLIGMTIYITLSNGIKIWQRLNQTAAQEDINIFFDRISRELGNTFEFSAVSFQGGEDRISFVNLLSASGLNQEEAGIGEVSYTYNKTNRYLTREERDYSQIYKGDSGDVKELLKDIDSLGFSYYFYDEEEKEYYWQEQWQGKDFPLAVKIELEFAYGRQLRKIVRTVDIPVAYPPASLND